MALLPVNALTLALAAPFAAALLIALTGRWLGRVSGLFLVAAALASFGAILSVVGANSPVLAVHEWVPSLGVAFRLRADAFGGFFALLISGIGVLVALYSLGYDTPELSRARVGRYYAELATFMGAMLGIALADDLILLFVFWEITSISSYLLIGFWYERDAARAGALTALLVTAMGGLAMLAGFVLIGQATGSFALSEIVADDARRAALVASPAFLPALALVLVGAFTKSAQFPFHFWLPGAMVAPTPISTYLHSATMVKAGVFLLARLAPLFAASLVWPLVVVPIGLATFFLGAWQSFRESDLKALLAYSTVSTLGLLTAVYGLRAPEQDVLQILSHATYKGSLFMIAGIVEHATGTRDLRELGGLRRTLPVSFALCVLGVMSMGGLPPLFGFVAKEALYASLLASPVLASEPLLHGFVIALVVVANGFLLASGLKLLIGTFLGEARGTHASHASHGTHEAHGEPVLLWLPAAVLALGALGLGLLSAGDTSERLVTGLSSAANAQLEVSLLPVHAGPLALSLFGLALGAAIYRARTRVEALQQRLDRWPDAQATWDALVAGLTRFAEAYSEWWQNGSLRWYFTITILFTMGIGFFALEAGGISIAHAAVSFESLDWTAAALAALILLATLAVIRSDTRLGSALALSASGFLVALLYAVYRSPDILLTQILIETVSTVVILLVLYFMPPFRKDGLSPALRAWNAAVSAGFGLVMFVFVLLCTSPAFRETRNLGQDYLARSLGEAGGRNAVNVIIVDFRAMDTIGEITVLVVVGLCVFGLLRARRGES
ncbi:MAG: hydrogen gas-evolving membrane-bound hydrogenase subunit E [Myxococcota bacterium]